MINILKTKRLEIKPLSKEDKNSLSEMLLNEDIKKTYMIPDFPDEEALDRMADRFLMLSCSNERFVRGVYLNNRMIGFVNDVEIKNGCIELGYVIHPDVWGNGYATEMLGAVIDQLLNEKFTSVRAGAFMENQASIRVMEKCGMKKLVETESIEYRGMNHICVYYEI